MGASANASFPYHFMQHRFWILSFCATVFTAEGERTAIPSTGENLQMRLEEAVAVKRPADRLKQISALCKDLSTADVARAVDLAKGLKEFRERGVLHEAALRRWCELDPQRAFEHLAAMPESRNKADTISYAAAKLVELDPAGVAVKVGKLPGRASRIAAIEAVAETWARKDPQAALKWSKALPDGFRAGDGDDERSLRLGTRGTGGRLRGSEVAASRQHQKFAAYQHRDRLGAA
jgi:hypothetical protein